MSNTRQYFPLSPKKIWKKTIGGTFACCCFSLFIVPFIGLVFASVIFGSLVGHVPALSFGLVVLFLIVLLLPFLLSFGLTYWYQTLYYQKYYYDLTESFIVIRKGVWTPREITIPYERVQDVYVDQDLLDRAFGLYDVHLSSATVSSGMEAHIDGVEQQAADGLRQVLLKTVNEHLHRQGPSGSSAPVVPSIPQNSEEPNNSYDPQQQETK